MILETEGLVLKQRNTPSGKKILIIFTKKYGKISAWTSVANRGKSKSSLFLKPFTVSNFELYKNKDVFNVNHADVMESHYKIGENIDRYMASSSILELTEKVLEEREPQKEIYDLLVIFLDEIAARNTYFSTLTIAYKIKLLKYLGYIPQINSCVICGEKGNLDQISIKEGGTVCTPCYTGIKNKEEASSSLIFMVDFDIVDIIIFLSDQALSKLRKLKIEEKISEKLEKFLKEYYNYHLGIETIKSDEITLKNNV